MPQRFDLSKAAPEGFTAYLNVEKYLKQSGLDAKLLALVKTRVSQINGCEYCLHMHTQKARELGESEARLYLLNAWRESELYTPRERAALEWAETLTNIATTHAPDEVYDTVRRIFTEKELSDLSLAIAMINGWNRMLVGARAVHPADVRKAA